MFCNYDTGYNPVRPGSSQFVGLKRLNCVKPFAYCFLLISILYLYHVLCFTIYFCWAAAQQLPSVGQIKWLTEVPITTWTDIKENANCSIDLCWTEEGERMKLGGKTATERIKHHVLYTADADTWTVATGRDFLGTIIIMRWNNMQLLILIGLFYIQVFCTFSWLGLKKKTPSASWQDILIDLIFRCTFNSHRWMCCWLLWLFCSLIKVWWFNYSLSDTYNQGKNNRMDHCK